MKVENLDDIGAHGDVEHLRKGMTTTGVRNFRLSAKEMVWMTGVSVF